MLYFISISATGGLHTALLYPGYTCKEDFVLLCTNKLLRFCPYALSEGDFRSGNYVRRLIRRSHYATVGQTVCATVAQCEHYVRQFVKQFVQLSHSVNAV